MYLVLFCTLEAGYFHSIYPVEIRPKGVLLHMAVQWRHIDSKKLPTMEIFTPDRLGNMCPSHNSRLNNYQHTTDYKTLKKTTAPLSRTKPMGFFFIELSPNTPSQSESMILFPFLILISPSKYITPIMFKLTYFFNVYFSFPLERELPWYIVDLQ